MFTLVVQYECVSVNYISQVNDQLDVRVLSHWTGVTVATAGRHFYGLDGLAAIYSHVCGVLLHSTVLEVTW